MAKMRSPNCPQITFEEAAQKGRLVYQKEHTHPAPKEAVANDLGYGGLNGRSLMVLGALRQYGILEASGEGLRVSEDAVTYYELKEGAEWEDAVRRLVYHPSLFDSLRVQFGDTLPSEATLKHSLIKQGFLPKAAEEVIEVYRENQKLVQSLTKRYNENEQDAQEDAMTTQPYSPPMPQPSSPTVSVQSFSFPLSPDSKADLQLRGAVGLDELELLRDHIELTIRALARAQKTKPVDVEAPRPQSLPLNAEAEGDEASL
jgi:hypothetical protein